MKLIKTISILLAFNLGLVINCSSKEEINEDFNASISGLALINNIPAKSVTFVTTSEFLYNNLNTETVTIICDAKGNFKFNKRLKKRIEKVKIIINSISQHTLSNQYIEAGDQIEITFFKNENEVKLQFAGPGSEKYNCIYNVNEAINNTQGLKSIIYSDSLKGEKFIEQTIVNSDIRKVNAISILNNYKEKISFEIFKLVEFDINGYFGRNMMQLFILLYPRDENGGKIEQLYNLEFQNLLDTTQAKLRAMSVPQIELLYFASAAKLMFNKKSKTKTLAEICQQIKTDYTGLLREKVLTFYLLSTPQGNSEDYINAVNEVIGDFKSDIAVEFLNQRLLSFAKMPLMDFAMEDKKGRIRHIADFKGKVVLIDLWFTGCIPCIEVSKSIKDKILPYYKNESNLEFVTINLDGDREKWLNSIKGGQYTNYRSIDLFTGGKKFEHPFIKNYLIRALPYLFLVNKEGILVKFNLSRETDEIIKEINLALK